MFMMEEYIHRGTFRVLLLLLSKKIKAYSHKVILKVANYIQPHTYEATL